MKAGRFLLRGTARSPDMYASIDQAADKIERQLKKHKEKLTNHHKSNGTPAPWAPVDVRHDVLDILEHPERPSHRVVKSEQFQARPMTVDDAILQLELLDAKFYVFQNAEDRAVNVVYRREDGSFGLIEARAVWTSERDRSHTSSWIRGTRRVRPRREARGRRSLRLSELEGLGGRVVCVPQRKPRSACRLARALPPVLADAGSP